MSTKMKKIFNFTKKKRAFSPNTSDTGSVLSVGYDLKEKDLGKVHKAASTGDVAKLRQLAKKNDLNQLDKENRTALHIACVNGHTDVVQFLVESKAKLNLCDNQNRSALMKAVQCQQDRCIAVLLEHEADPNLVDINGNTALHLAARIPSPSIAVLLLEHEANINAQNKDGSTPLSLAVEENHPEMAELLLKECADVNMKNLEKRSPLMIAACNGQISMVRLLLDYNADISVKDDKGWSSDDYAVMNGHHACSHLIIEHGTKRRSLQSPSISNKRKQMSMLPSTGGMEATFMLGGPAIDKDGAEDNSHTESISRASKSGPADSWPSSDEDNELDLNPKKPQKVNLKTLLNASKKENKASGVEFLEQPSHSNPGEVSADEEDDESLEENESEGDEEEDDDEDDDDDDDEEEQDEDNDDEDEEEEDDDNDEEEGGDEDEESEESDEYNQEQKSGINIENIFQNVAAAVPEIDIQDTAPDRISVEEPLTQICPVVTQQIEKEESAHNSCGIAGNICLEEDCVVSAIRVQSRFSDEEECDGRISGPGSAMSPTPNICNAPQGNVTEGDSLENDDCNDDDDDWDDENDDELQIAEHLNLHNECERDIKSPDVYLPPKTPCLMAQEDKIDIFKHEDEEEGEHSDGTKKAECNQSPRPKLLYPENTFTGKTSQGDEVKKCDEDLETSSQEDSWGDEGDEAKTKPDEEEEGEVSDTGSPQHDYSVTVDKENTSFFHTNVPNVDKTEDNVAFSGESLHDDDMPVSMIVGHYECASKLSDKDGAEREEEYRKDKEDRKSVDSDSEVQEMHYDFASGTVRITREEQDDSENSMQLDEEGKNNEDGDCIACSSPKVSKSIFTMESNSNPESASQSPKRSRFQTRDSKGAQRDLNLTPLQYLDIELNKTPTPCPGSQELCSDDDDDRNDDISNVNKLQQCEPEPVGEEASDLETTLQQITKDIENPPNYLHDVDEEAEGLEIRMEERPVIDFRNTEDGPLQENDSMEDEEEEDEEQDEDDEEEDDEDETVEMEKIKEGEDTLLKTKSNQRDFLTELGLEKGDEEDDSPWDSESDCDSSRKQHCSGSSSPLKPHNIMTKISEENHEDLSYIPSFIRGTRNCNLETWGGIDRPGSKREKALCGDHFDGRPQEAAAEIQKSAASRREPMLVLNKLMETKEEVEKKTDLMEELGLADVDDLEDSSDWDSSSASSKINPPCSSEETRKLASSPALNSTLPTLMEQEQERPSSGEETEDPRLQTRPSPSGSALQPQPQPRTRRHIKAEDKEESASSSQTDTDAEGETKQEGSVLNAVGSAYRAVLDQDRNRALEDATRSSAFSGHDLERGEKSEMTLGNHRHKQEGSLRNPRDQASPTMDTVKRKHGSRSPSRTPTYREHHGYKDEERKMNALGSQEALLVPAMVQVGASQHEVHLNGDRLSVFDDSTLSEMSDDEGRSPSAVHKDMESQMELAIDFDNLTQSSDTPTEELDSPSSGYRHASVLIKQLDSTSIDSVSMVKLQNMFHEYERTIQRERSRYGRQADKLHQLEQERAELRLLLGETRDSQSNLEHCKVELETDINNLRFLLKQEQEKHRSASMLYEKTRDQLRRKEDQHQLEEEERQKLELSIRNLELEKRALINSIKQVEEDRNEIQRLLVQERSARSLQEEILNSHLRKQQEIEVENRKNLNKSNETLAQLTEASDREKELLQQVCGLQEELSVLRTELEHGRCHSKQEESRLSDENEMIRERLEDTRRDLKMSEEALAQTVFQYNGQLSTLKAECQVTASRLEQERATRQQLESEVESARSRLQVALQEVDRCQAVRAEADRALQREREERQRAQEKRAGEAGAHRDAVHDLSQQLSKAEARANSLENECHRTALALTEKGLLLEKTAHEREQALVRLRETEAALQVEREQVTRSGAKQEAMQERLAQAQSEAALLRQQLEEVQSKGVAKERAVSDAQERFSDIVAKLRSDSEERVMLVEERRQELANQNAELRKQNLQLEQDKAERETSVRQLQQELADSLKKLSMCEASLEVNTRYRTDLENEKTRTLQDMDRLKSKLQESEDQYVQAERRINSLKCSLDEKEREVVASAQKLQDVLSTSAATEKTVRQLEETVQRLEIENARLEAAAKQQSHRIEMLQKGAQEAAAPSDSSPGGGIRNRLEDLVTNLQSSKMTLEDQLSREVQKHSMLSHNAQDSQALWEEELKSRSKLSLRLSELEKEKGELTNQMEIEKKKAKKIAEHKKSVDARLAEEMKRNTELQKEMYRLRTLVKTAKKKLREQDCAEFGSPLSSLKGGMDLRHSEAEAAISRMKAKVDELQIQLDKEASRCSRLEEVNRDLKDQLSSLKGLSRSHERLERNKRQLEEEVLGLRRQMDAGVMDQNQADLYRRETEERARQEIRQKLEEVNLFLQTQAASQEALEQIKATNEASQRAELEQRIKDLERELGQARSTQHDSLVQRDSSLTELERYRQLYSEELRLRKSLTTKLERCNERLAEANTKLLTERQRSKSLITSTLVNGSLGGPSVEVGSLGSLGAYGSTLGPLNRSLGLGGSILGSVSDHQSNRIESYLAKMQSELEKNISKELDNATAGLDGGSPRLSPVGSAYGSQKSLTAEQDPVSRATQQYLEVLKKNYMI
ncbi:ankyrin repeat domain-containing protein 26 isoform X10 [Denticeps clupeoides]|uniref:ankyrin repeat domain-containing protein 26 isoform X10 n=1 Tax=Denticeps clupeoides TaxID=299321 RepID=UPI0010A418D5|nr:ankyrin repeat domain-containing protein 26-like isoform X10 [Denticeps clupeoides]